MIQQETLLNQAYLHHDLNPLHDTKQGNKTTCITV
jgi:hypothetical protein